MFGVASYPSILFNNYAGVQGLSGSSACRWYIDEDLPVINDFRNR